MKALEFKRVHYIKLGKGGKWADDCFKKGIIRFGWENIEGVDEINRKEWDKIAEKIKVIYKDKRNGATQDINALTRICDATQDEVFITFHKGSMFWCQPKNGPVKKDSESKYRECLRGWSDKPIGADKPLFINDISGYLTKTQGFQGTTCELVNRQKEIAWRLINNLPKESIKEVKSLKNKLIINIIDLLKDLHPKDCEILADLIFQRTGWQRISMHGENMKFIDMQYVEPITGNRYDVQVKSGAGKKEFDDYIQKYRDQKTTKFYFIVFNPEISLKEVVVNDPKIELLMGEKLSELIFDLGLLNWLLQKSY